MKIFAKFVVCLIALTVVGILHVVTAAPENVNQNTAMCSLASAINIIQQSDIEGWGCSNNIPFIDVCDWTGVTCSSKEVVVIDVNSRSLKGFIPSSIGYLTQLTTLRLYTNSFSNTIPTEINLLTNLVGLQLYENKFNGTIPYLGNLLKVTNFKLYDNCLTGTIPTYLGTLSNVLALELSNNPTSGGFPTHLTALTKLTSLKLYANKLTGPIPSEIAELTNLQTLYLYTNLFTGPLPTSIGNLVKLTNLQFSNNQISGTFPSEIGYLTALSVLKAFTNSFSGTLSSNLGTLTNLKTFYLYSNLMVGSIPNSFSKLTALSDLRLNGNSFNGDYPIEICSNTKLTYFTLTSGTLQCNKPTREPTISPTTSSPTRLPTVVPTRKPTFLPTTSVPTAIPTTQPTFIPSYIPTILPTRLPTSNPTSWPTFVPNVVPSKTPTFLPTSSPTKIPTVVPTEKPTISPTFSPTTLSDPHRWSQAAKLHASDPMTSDYFGVSVSIDGDSLVVGAHTQGSNDAGAAYYFVRTNSYWSQISKIVAFDAAASDLFGVGLCLKGDMLIVGALGDDNIYDAVGSAYIFNRINAQWTFSGKLNPSDPQNAVQGTGGQQFGRYVSFDESSLMIGAYTDHTQGYQTGAVYAYNKVGSAWVFQTKLYSPNPQVSALFGSVALYGDNVFISAFLYDWTYVDQGIVFVYEKISGAWTYLNSLFAPDAAISDVFGVGMTIYKDVAFIGSFADTYGANSGVVYMYVRTNGQWSFLSKMKPPTDSISSYFSVSLSFDGQSIAVGAHTDDTKGIDTGVTYVFSYLYFSSMPTLYPTSLPTVIPSFVPTHIPTMKPTRVPTNHPSSNPSAAPTIIPSSNPSSLPSIAPTSIPTSQPSEAPSSCPSSGPTSIPTCNPSMIPTNTPSASPSSFPSSIPSEDPTSFPSLFPTISPSSNPTGLPSSIPSGTPSSFPSSEPTVIPSSVPSLLPTSSPSTTPTSLPSSIPSGLPSCFPSAIPSSVPSVDPSVFPTNQPTVIPTSDPTSTPSSIPTTFPSSLPSSTPTIEPTSLPTGEPSSLPSSEPTCYPSAVPSNIPSGIPSSFPSVIPTGQPSSQPSSIPSNEPTALPSYNPSSLPSSLPTATPTHVPTTIPTVLPTRIPSTSPTLRPTVPPGESPIPPELMSARLSDDGSYVSVILDSLSDMGVYGGLSQSFPCSSLLKIIQSSSVNKAIVNVASKYTCVWESSYQLKILPMGTSTTYRLQVNDSVTLLPQILRSKCSLTSNECKSWLTSTSSNIISIQSPLNPVKPIVRITSSSVLGICDDLFLNIQTSSGSGGVSWKSFNIKVKLNGVSSADSLAVEAFIQSSSFQLVPPTPIPRNLLKSGQYDFYITLCNYLLACSDETKFSVLVESKTIPTVMIYGSDDRVAKRNKGLLLTGYVSMAICNSSVTGGSQVVKTTSGFHHNWMIFEISRNSSLVELPMGTANGLQFALGAYSLVVSKSYIVRLQSQYISTNAENYYDVKITVQPSNVMAFIKGGSVRSLSADIGSYLSIDGSGSYDEDVQGDKGVKAGLHYSWSCVQLQQSLESSLCTDLKIDTSNPEVALVGIAIDDKTALAKLVGNEYEIILSVFSADHRNATSSVRVVIVPSLSPVVSLSLLSTGSQKVNAANKVRVLATVQLFTNETVTATWNIDHFDTIALQNMLLTGITRSFSRFGTYQFNLVLASNALIPNTESTIGLQVGSGTSSLLVAVNGPPRPGVVQIDPSSGKALADDFTLSANSWLDDDLPLTVQIGFIDSSSQSIVTLKPRSESSMVVSHLPVGDESDDFRLYCVFVIYDGLDSFTDATVPATVTNITMNITAMANSLSNAIEDASDNVEDSMKVISIYGTMLTGSSRECNLAPNCTSLHRNGCNSLVPNSCGSCFEGFVGGIGNSICVDLSSFVDIQSSIDVITGCDTNWGYYNYETKQCEIEQKECLNDCSSHGECFFVNVNNDALLTDCNKLDVSCVAKCRCETGYSGDYCESGITELEEKQALKLSLINSLHQIISTADLSISSLSNVISWLSNLQSLSVKPRELSETSCKLVAEMLYTLLEYSVEGAIPYDEVGTEVSSILSSIFDCSDNLKHDPSIQFLYGNSSILLHELMLSGLVSGENTVELISNNAKYLVGVFDGDSSVLLSEPLTVEEAAFMSHNNQSRVTVSDLSIGNSGYQSTLSAQMEIKRLKLYGNRTEKNYLSNVVSLSVHLSSSSSSSLASSSAHMSIQLPTVVNVASNNSTSMSSPPSLLISYCALDVVNSTSFYCPDTNFTVIHSCNGSFEGVQTSQCPVLQLVPTCQILSSGMSGLSCDAFGTPGGVITCNCQLHLSPPVKRRRRLASNDKDDILEQSGAVEVVASSEMVIVEFESTIIATKDFDSIADVERVLIVIVLYSTLWLVGLASLLYFICYRPRTKVANLNKFQSEKEKKIAEASSSLASAKTNLLKYIDVVFPAVFNRGPWLQRLWREIMKHHRYIVIFTPRGTGGDDRSRVVILMQLLTIQSMLMFMLAVLYDIQFPTDNGRCESFSTEESCLHLKSAFDLTETLCRWDDTESTCYYIQPKLTWKIFFLFSILVAIFTAPVNLLVDFLFCDILLAPNADQSKIIPLNEKIAQTGRRMSNAIRRASNVAVTAARASMSKVLKRNTSFLSIVTTRDIPQTTIRAHELACASSVSILDKVKSYQQQYAEMIASQRQQFNFDSIEFVKLIPMLHSYSVECQELLVEILCQRNQLNSSELVEFDSRWGLEENGLFSTKSLPPITWSQFMRYYLCLGKKDCVMDRIESEIKRVKEISRKKVDKLSYAKQSHVGIELLHLFILDLLGRQTAAAKIFQAKTEIEFQQKAVLSRWIKYSAWIVVAILNLFFVYFSLIRGMQRGNSWQRGYLFACIVQIIVEITFYETSECVWVHFIIPSVVGNEIRTAQFALRQAISSICTDGSRIPRLFLDATKYLFVSREVSNHFPNLVESALIQSYHNHMVGDIGKGWMIRSPQETLRLREGRRMLSCDGIVNADFTITAMLLYGLQQFGATPATIQRVLIHSLQPLVLSSIILFGELLIHQPLLALIFTMFIIYWIYSYLVKYWARYSREKPIIVPDLKGSLIKSRVRGGRANRFQDFNDHEHDQPPLSPPLNEDIHVSNNHISFQISSMSSSSSSDDNDDDDETLSDDSAIIKIGGSKIFEISDSEEAKEKK